MAPARGIWLVPGGISWGSTRHVDVANWTLPYAPAVVLIVRAEKMHGVGRHVACVVRRLHGVASRRQGYALRRARDGGGPSMIRPRASSNKRDLECARSGAGLPAARSPFTHCCGAVIR